MPDQSNANVWFYAWRELGTFLEQCIQDPKTVTAEQEACRAVLWRMNRMEMQIVRARETADKIIDEAPDPAADEKST